MPESEVTHSSGVAFDMLFAQRSGLQLGEVNLRLPIWGEPGPPQGLKWGPKGHHGPKGPMGWEGGGDSAALQAAPPIDKVAGN